MDDRFPQDSLELQFHDLDFSIKKTRRYHEKLSAFYDVWRTRFRVVTIVAGSGAFVIVLANNFHAAELIVTAFVGLWAMLDLVLAPDKKHELHRDLSRKFILLAAKIENSPRTKGALQALRTERLLLEVDEPPCKRLVDLEARNDECRSRDYTDLVPLSRTQRFFGYYMTFGMKRLEDWKAEQQG